MQPAHDPAERLARLRLIRSENVGPVTYKRLLDRYDTAAAALEALPQIAERAGKRRLKIASEADAQREWQTVENFGARFLMQGDDDFPEPLAQTEGGPPVLTVYGDTSLLSKPTLAIVGARNASANGRALCRTLARELGEAGLVIASGLARGIDAEAHAAALDTGTIAVIAGGIDVIYPTENEKLQRDIANRGVIVAESAFGTRPIARHFPKRNRIISGLARGVLVVEAALRSGSLITARQAGEQGRDVFAVPGSPLDPRAKGCNQLIRDGARLVQSADDVLEELSPSQPGHLQAPIMGFHNEPAEYATGDDAGARAVLLQALSAAPTDADVLIRAAQLTSAVFNAAILELEITGQAVRHAGNRYALKLDE